MSMSGIVIRATRTEIKNDTVLSGSHPDIPGIGEFIFYPAIQGIRGPFQDVCRHRRFPHPTIIKQSNFSIRMSHCMNRLFCFNRYSADKLANSRRQDPAVAKNTEIKQSEDMIHGATFGWPAIRQELLMNEPNQRLRHPRREFIYVAGTSQHYQTHVVFK